MHTFKAGDIGGYETTFNFNSDLSGTVTIIRNGDWKNPIAIHGSHLLAFVAHYIRSEKISRVEQASDMQVLMGDAG